MWFKQGKMATHIFSSAGNPPRKRAATNIYVVTRRRMANTIGLIGRLRTTTRQLVNRNR